MPSEEVKCGKQWKETVQTICAIALLLTFFVLCRPGFLQQGSTDGSTLWPFGRAQADAEAELEDDDTDLRDVGFEDEFIWQYAEIPPMPSFFDLRESLKALEAARNKLASSTLDGDAQAIALAQSEYEQTTREVECSLAKLSTIIFPDEFACLSDDLLPSCRAEGRGN
jgi:hypothetical protein